MSASTGNTYPTLLNVSKLYTADGSPLPVAEMLQEQNPILDDVPWYEANQTNGHRLAVRTGLPSVVWRKLNAGVPPSKSEYADVTESCGMLTALGKIDKALADMSPNPADFRVRENKGHFTAMNKEFASTLIYGDTDIDPEKFLGLAPRFSDLTGPENAENIIDAAGNDTDLASIFLVGWGEEGAFGIYPKGSQAGLVHQDYGVELVQDGSGGEFPAYRDWFEWRGGVAVKDWRNVARIANIDLSNLTADGATGAKLIDLMVQAIELIEAPDAVKLAFYMPRKIRTFLRLQINNKSNLYLKMEEIAGRKVLTFDGYPVRRVDAMLGNESRIV